MNVTSLYQDLIATKLFQKAWILSLLLAILTCAEVLVFCTSQVCCIH